MQRSLEPQVKRTPTVLHAQTPLHHIALAPPYHAFARDIPDGVNTIPSMMSVGERRFIYNLVREKWSGRGIILDAGLMCGASTEIFHKAMKASGISRQPAIVSIEKAVAGAGEAQFIRNHAPGWDIEIGDSFAPVVEQFLAPFRDLVDLRIGDIADVGKLPAPIEVLYLDVLKSRETALFVTAHLFPLLTGESYILQQDYFADFMPWIKEMQEYICTDGGIRYIGEIGPMAVFHCKRMLRRAHCETAPLRMDFAQASLLLSAAEERSTDPARRLLCALSRVWRAAELVGPERARQTLEGIKDCYSAQISNMKAKRLQNALRAAEYLCSTAWSEEVAQQAKLISTGHKGKISGELAPPQGSPADL